MSSSDEPTAKDAKVLFENIEQKFPSKTLGGERWYLVAVIFPSLLIHKILDVMPLRLPPSREAVNPSLPGLYTRISSKDHAMSLPKIDRL